LVLTKAVLEAFLNPVMDVNTREIILHDRK
jgi:hypothetical protein